MPRDPLHVRSSGGNQSPRRWWVRKRLLWWSAVDPDEPLATMDTNTVYRAWTRDRLMRKLAKLSEPRATPWEEVRIP